MDGSRAANLLGWQWTARAGRGKPYGFARWQVEKRAPGLCFNCPLEKNCQIEEFPDEVVLHQMQKNPLLDSDVNSAQAAGPAEPEVQAKAKMVLLTVDSLGDADPALAANPDLPVVFVFNEDVLRKLQLSSMRIGFYIESLKDLSARRELKVFLGNPYLFTEEHDVAITFAPVPSFRKFKNIAELHPFSWLRRPQGGSVRSYSSWRGKIDPTSKKI